MFIDSGMEKRCHVINMTGEAQVSDDGSDKRKTKDLSDCKLYWWMELRRDMEFD